jgi:hypothetical protein
MQASPAFSNLLLVDLLQIKITFLRVFLFYFNFLRKTQSGIATRCRLLWPLGALLYEF